MSAPLPEELAGVFQELAKCIVGLGPYQEDAVLCGGIVPVLYRQTLPQAATRLRPLTTFDLDWILPKPLTDRGESLHERLLSSGFVARQSGSHKLPVTQYVPDHGQAAASSPIYVEFLTPRHGSKRNRQGTNQGVVEVQAGLHAQTDPYLGLLLAEKITVRASAISELSLSAEHRLSLPHPACFILQKLLIRKRRGTGKQDSDACHIYDVAILTRALWPQMSDVLKQLKAGPRFPRNWFAVGERVLRDLFSESTSNGCLAVARHYSGAVSEDEVCAGMSAFLAECWLKAR